MEEINNKKLSERDILTKFTTPIIENAGWDKTTQARIDPVSFTIWEEL